MAKPTALLLQKRSLTSGPPRQPPPPSPSQSSSAQHLAARPPSISPPPPLGPSLCPKLPWPFQRPHLCSRWASLPECLFPSFLPTSSTSSSRKSSLTTSALPDPQVVWHDGKNQPLKLWRSGFKSQLCSMILIYLLLLIVNISRPHIICQVPWVTSFRSHHSSMRYLLLSFPSY